MKKLYPLLSVLFLIFWGCEEETEEQNDFVFKITDQGYFGDDFLVIIHDAETPHSEPLASAYVEQGGTVTFNNDNVEGNLINDMNDSIIIDLSNEINLSDIGSELIVTTGTFDENYFSLTSNWHVKKGSEWTMVGDTDFIDWGNDTVNVTIEAPSDKHITNYATDIGDYFNAGYGYYDVNITRSYNVSAVNSDNRLNISSVVRLNDGNWYLSYLENRQWTRGIGFTIDDWIPDVVYKMNIPISNLDDKSYFYITSSKHSTNFSVNSERTLWRTYWYYTYEPDTLNGSVGIMTTDAIPFADKRRVYCYFRNDDGYKWNADYGDFQEGDIVSPKNMDLSFNYSGATGTALDISASNDVDQIRFYYGLSDNENGYNWKHYFDPEQMDRFDIPNLGNQVNLNIEWAANPIVYDYDNFESNADIVKALFEDNNFWTSWTDRHYNYIPNLTNSQVSHTMSNSKNNNGNANLYLDKQHGINNLGRQLDKGIFH